MKYLVTGGAGFIGGHLTDRLLSKYMVIGVDNLSSGLMTVFITGSLVAIAHRYIFKEILKHKNI